MKYITTNLLNRLWKNGVLPALAKKSDTGHLHTWDNITDKPSVPTSGDFSTNTLEDLLKSVQGKSPKMGSASITKDSRITSMWWNFLYVPHRTGVGGDNGDYGTLLLFPMTGEGASYVVRAGKGGTVASIHKIYTDGNKPSKSDIGLGNVDNTADKDKSVKYATSAGNAATTNGHTVNSDVPANAKFTDTYNPVICGVFFREDDEHIILFTSQDGLTFRSCIDTGLIGRDPSYMCVNGRHYIACTMDSPKNFRLFYSDDFTTWTTQDIDINVPHVSKVWAPDLYYDGDKVYCVISGDYITGQPDVDGGSISAFKQYYSIGTVNGKTITWGNAIELPFVKNDTTHNNYIDGTLCKVGSLWYFAVKNEYDKTLELYSGASFTALKLVKKFNDFKYLEGPSLCYDGRNLHMYADHHTADNGPKCYVVYNATKAKYFDVLKTDIRLRHGSVFYCNTDSLLKKINDIPLNTAVVNYYFAGANPTQMLIKDITPLALPDCTYFLNSSDSLSYKIPRICNEAVTYFALWSNNGTTLTINNNTFYKNGYMDNTSIPFVSMNDTISPLYTSVHTALLKEFGDGYTHGKCMYINGTSYNSVVKDVLNNIGDLYQVTFVYGIHDVSGRRYFNGVVYPDKKYACVTITEYSGAMFVESYNNGTVTRKQIAMT